MESTDAADAMRFDGVRPETILVPQVCGFTEVLLVEHLDAAVARACTPVAGFEGESAVIAQRRRTVTGCDRCRGGRGLHHGWCGHSWRGVRSLRGSGRNGLRRRCRCGDKPGHRCGRRRRSSRSHCRDRRGRGWWWGERTNSHDDHGCAERDAARCTASQPSPTDPAPGQGDHPDDKREEPQHHCGAAETGPNGADHTCEGHTAPAERVGRTEPSTTCRCGMP